MTKSSDNLNPEALGDLYEAAAEAKVLIGAKNDNLTEAQRQANVNRAWHVLDAALTKARPQP